MSNEPPRSQAPARAELDAIVKRHVIAAFAVGCTPIPLLDVTALAGVQLNLARKLARVHGVPFSEEAASGLISAIIGSALPVRVAPALVRGISGIPLTGPAIGLFSKPLLSAVATYGLGQLFIEHFSSGETLVALSATKARGMLDILLRRTASRAGRPRAGTEVPIETVEPEPITPQI